MLFFLIVKFVKEEFYKLQDFTINVPLNNAIINIFFFRNMAQSLKVLLWKMYILRKRRWFITFLEVVIPILMFWLLVYFKNITPDDSEAQKIQYDSPSPYKIMYLGGRYKLAYTSLNNVSEAIMQDVFNNINKSCPGKFHCCKNIGY